MAVRPDFKPRRYLQDPAKEASLLDAYRNGRLTHFELSELLGLDRFQTEAWLKSHNVTEDLPTIEELEADRETLSRLLGAGR
jgi:hypothetical protein